MTPRILAFAGSARRESFNKTMIKIAAAGAEAAGAKVTLIDLADYPLPLFNQDEEAANGSAGKRGRNSSSCSSSTTGC